MIRCWRCYGSLIKPVWRISGRAVKESLFVPQDEFAPLKRQRKKDSTLWWKAGMCRAIQRRDRSWFLCNSHESSRAWVRYAKHRNEAKRSERKAKHNQEAKLVSCLKNSPKKYYAYVQSTGSQQMEILLQWMTAARQKKWMTTLAMYIGQMRAFIEN